MPGSRYPTWPTDAVIPLKLELAESSGLGSTGKSPSVSIRRFKDTRSSTLLDNWFWNGTTFQVGAFWFTMTEVDATDSAGLYRYLFQQDLIQLEHTYHAYFRHTVAPVGFSAETHVVTREAFVPTSSPDPIVVGPNSIMGQLELIKDGGGGDFDATRDSLHDLGTSLARTLGLLHANSVVDNQTYDVLGQLTAARLRIFDSEANVPTIPGGSETTGLIHEYNVIAEYAGQGVLTNYQLRQVL